MLMDDISNAPKSVLVSPSTVNWGEIGTYEAIAPGEVKDRIQVPVDLDHLKATKYNNQVLESVVHGASQENRIAHIQGLVGWFGRLKRAIGMFKKKHALHTEKAENVKPRRWRMYILLYGGRVNVNTFYDYEDKL